jgi:ClpP class serine protease
MKQFSQIITALYRQPLAITPAGFESLDAIFQAHVKGERPAEDFFGGQMAQMEIDGDLAVIPIFGPLIQHASLMDKKCGATSYDDIRADIVSAIKNPDVESIILNFDSPGGQVSGCLELAEFIKECPKDIYAFTDSSCCSAAYWLASSCDGFFCSRTAFTGSIGCIMSWMDESKSNEMQGYKPMIFSSGKFKATPHPGVTPDADQAAYIQGIIDSGFELFEAAVLESRPDVDTDKMQGQVMSGLDAVKFGLADDNMDSVEDVADFLDPMGNG